MKRWIVLVAFFLSACAGYGQKEPPPKPFTATKWQLVMDIPPAGELPWVRFGDGRMEGFGGCSRFAGRYVQDAVGARAIAVGRIQVDRRLCDASAADAEARLLEVLQVVSSYSVTADMLTMSGSGGTLKFRAADATAPSVTAIAPVTATPAAAAAPPAAAASSAGVVLANTRWRGVAPGVDEGSTPWLEFVDGRVAGYTGCNMMSGPWKVENGEIRVGPLATTKRACAGPGSEVEHRVLSGFGGRVTREGGRLTAVGPGGERIEFIEVK
jgi:heat shock protein HslJ